ncbi:tRNA threonylcarbamoyladenosine biosynthesis protein TsaE [Daejeonella rubra]|uniref:tRNA threonylcarbamoyladenosine biosynthesis protein TsaE n=1 Tax=Daejeonella rubra TaxID=990371 RepID=A0A1G9RLS6_9SPHI|nr:tRNA (adenosine(37)-N6)-threonylcarbamoyltransferase complex ATPase subunit type 1 TsaE [Daejeonella rubra]SDM24203.1 tRNA threonylcarbamoyladenosine biosynthesis protein TsaE [Daejeonella rubra]
MEILIDQENELPAAASALLKFAGNEKIFLFEGEMGAGKTTLIKSLCLQLGMIDNVSSPTYSIVNEYVFPEGKIYHFDFFRIKDESEAFDIGFEEYLMSGEYCFIEWPEMIAGLWPEHFIEIKVVEAETGIRKISAHKI